MGWLYFCRASAARLTFETAVTSSENTVTMWALFEPLRKLQQLWVSGHPPNQFPPRVTSTVYIDPAREQLVFRFLHLCVSPCGIRGSWVLPRFRKERSLNRDLGSHMPLAFPCGICFFLEMWYLSDPLREGH